MNSGRRIRRDLEDNSALFRLYALTARLRNTFSEALIYYRSMAPSTRPVEGGSRRAINRDVVINALANRCLGLTDSIITLCRADAFDDAYALGRVGLEAVTHLEFLTRNNWPVRIDTYVAFLDAHHIRLRDVFFGERSIPALTAEEWADKERRVMGIFGASTPEHWRVFLPEHFPSTVKPTKRVKKDGPLYEMSFRSEFMSVQSDDTESFLLKWIYPDTSGYVHTDATSLHSAVQELLDSQVYRVQAARGGPASRHALMLAVTLQLATVTALASFTGVSCEPRLSQLSDRLRRIIHHRHQLVDSIRSTP